MVTPTPKRISNGYAGLHYILQEEAHVGSGARNHYVSKINCFEHESVYKQFRDVWQNCTNPQHKIQLRHYIISFSKDELSAENEADICFAHEAATEYFEQYFPGRQIILASQSDSKGGCLHIHAMVNDHRLKDNRGLTEKERSRGYFRKTATAFFQQKFEENNITYDYGRNHKVYSQYEREFAEKFSKYRHYRDTYKEETAKENPDQTVIDDCKKGMKENKYVWKAHLAQNISVCRHYSTTWDEFTNMLPVFGIEMIDEGKHIKFRLTEEEYAAYSDEPYPTKAICRGKTLDPKYSRDALHDYFDTMPPEQKAAIIAERDALDAQIGRTPKADYEEETEESLYIPEIDFEEEQGILDKESEDTVSDEDNNIEETHEFSGFLLGDVADYLKEHPEHPLNRTGSPDYDYIEDRLSRVRKKKVDEEPVEPPIEKELYEEPEDNEVSNQATEDWMLKVAKEYDKIGKYMNEDVDEDDIGAVLEAKHSRDITE